MQNLNKLSKIIAIVFVLLISSIILYYFFVIRNIDVEKIDEKDLIKKNAAEELLQNNADALKNADNTRNGLVRKIDKTDHVLGNITAPIEIIVYDDFDNEYSADYYKTIMQALKANGDKIAVAYRHFPMRSHAYSNIAAIASECASEKDLFWGMAEKLFLAKSEEKLSEDYIILIAQELGLDLEKFKTCLTDEKISDKIQASITEADSINVTGVPTTFINSVPYPGAMPYEDFKDSSGLERKGLKSIINQLIAF